MSKKVLSELSISTVSADKNQENIFDYITKNLKGVAERLAPKLNKKPEEVTFTDVSIFIHNHDEEND